VPYRLDYQLATTDRYATERLVLRTLRQGWHRALELERDTSGRWSCQTEAEGSLDLPAPGGDLAAVAGALDCDLSLSPLTNSMPVLRHRLPEGGGPVDFRMAWVSVPDLVVHARDSATRSCGRARTRASSSSRAWTPRSSPRSASTAVAWCSTTPASHATSHRAAARSPGP
jgi:hypothetical protein